MTPTNYWAGAILAARDEFSPSTKDLLAKQAGWLCANPECGAATVGAKMGTEDGFLNLGEAAHITAAASGPGAARHDASLTSAQRKSPSNGIWLCRVCARAIDSDDSHFTVEQLRGWKEAARKRSWQLATGHVAPFELAQPSATLGTTDGGDLDATLARLILGARADIDAFMATRRWPAHPVELTLRLRGPDATPPFDSVGLATALATFNEVAVVAPPGTGKSTTLLQVANALVSQGWSVPIFLPLAEWSTQTRTIWETILARRAFRDKNASVADLDLLASAGRMTLLLDGWNELDAHSQSRLRTELEVLQREVPSINLVLSTRRQALAVPLQDAVLVDIDALSDVQQLAIARGLRGHDGETLIDNAWRTDGVRELVSIPLYLTALLTHTPGDAFPQTKEEVLRLFVREHERTPGNAEALRQKVSGHQDHYLTKIAVEATVVANTAVTEARARSIVSGVGKTLQADGQITSVAEPIVIVDALVGYHALLRAAGDTGNISFQHQQIQEWYASFEVERVMLDSAAGSVEATGKLRQQILDIPAWEEAILFAVERLSRSNEKGTAAVSAAILLAMEIDPMLAADMIYRSAPEAWTPIAETIRNYCDRWHTVGHTDRATGFMIRTGRPEFADDVWLLIENPDANVYLQALRTPPRFRTTVLGANVDQRMLALPDETRAHVISEIARQSGYDGLELATKLTRADPSNTVKFSVVESLAFRRADRFVAQILRDADDDLWHEIALRGYPDASSDPAIASRLASDRQKLAQAETDPLKRIRWILAGVDRSDKAADEIKTLTVGADFSTLNQHDDNLIYEAHKVFPNSVSEAFVERLVANRVLPVRANRYLRTATAEFDDGELVKAVLSAETDEKFARTAAAVIGPKTIGKLIDELLVLDSKWRANKSGLSATDRDRTLALGNIIAVTRLRAFLQALLQRTPDSEPQAIGRLADLFSRHGVDEEGRAQRPPADVIPDLNDLVVRWAETLLGAEIFARGDAANVALAIARLKSPELVPVVTKLLAEDLAARQRALAVAAVQGPGRSDALNESRTLNTTQYQLALPNIGTEEAAQVLISHLRNIEFGFAAAVALKQIWDREHDPSPPKIRNWPDYSSVRARRAERAAGRESDNDVPFAAVILDAASDLMKDDRGPTAQGLAIKIARIGLGLPHADRDTLVDDLLKLPGHRTDKQLLLATLAIDGIVIDSNVVLAGIREFLDEWKIHSWMLPQNVWELEGWLELIPFSDRPSAVFEAIAMIPAGYTSPHHLRRLLVALGNSPSVEAETILTQLAENDPRFREDYEWFNAFARRETIEWVQLLLGFIARGEVKSGQGGRDLMGLKREIAAMIDRNPETRAEIYRIYAQTPAGTSKSLIEQAIAESADIDGVLALVQGCGVDGKSFRQTSLHTALRRVMIDEQPSSHWQGAFDLIPVPVPALRKTLFGLANADTSTGRLARQCLVEIDTIRDEHGWEDEGPRHPDIASGRAWPLAIG